MVARPRPWSLDRLTASPEGIPMKSLSKSLLTLCLGTACLPVLAQTPCPAGTRLNENQLTTLLTNRTVCATVGNDRWQEWHGPNNSLVDYKRGPGHPVDPTQVVGSWAITGSGINAIVTYTYGTNSYAYAVCSSTPSGSYDFRPAASGGGQLVTGATFRPLTGTSTSASSCS
jgi:hypothetical protein